MKAGSNSVISMTIYQDPNTERWQWMIEETRPGAKKRTVLVRGSQEDFDGALYEARKELGDCMR